MTDDPVNHPAHYCSHTSGVECLDLTRGMTFTVGNAVKYVWRADLKNGRQDLEKAAFYLRDARDMDDPMYLSTTHRAIVADYLDRVIVHESGLRHSFFTALSDLDVEWALDCVNGMLEELDGIPPRNEGDGIVAAMECAR